MNLENLQREMAKAVMQPLTADEQMRERSADGRSMQTVAESFIAPTAASAHSSVLKFTTGNTGSAFSAHLRRILRLSAL